MDEGVVLIGGKDGLIIGARDPWITSCCVGPTGERSSSLIYREKSFADPFLDLIVAGDLITSCLLQLLKTGAHR